MTVGLEYFAENIDRLEETHRFFGGAAKQFQQTAWNYHGLTDEDDDLPSGPVSDEQYAEERERFLESLDVYEDAKDEISGIAATLENAVETYEHEHDIPLQYEELLGAAKSLEETYDDRWKEFLDMHQTLAAETDENLLETADSRKALAD